MSAIENDALVPQFKSLNCALCYNTPTHCATRCVRLLVPALPKPCAVVMFGIQLIKMSSRVDVYRTFSFLSTCFITFFWVFLLYTLIILWQKMAVNLHAVHKKINSRAAHQTLLTYFLLSCSTRIIACVQPTKKSSRAVHKI